MGKPADRDGALLLDMLLAASDARGCAPYTHVVLDVSLRATRARRRTLVLL